MDDAIKQRWSDLDDTLIFDFKITLAALAEGATVTALVYCHADLAECHALRLHRDLSCQIDFLFKSGCYVRGHLRCEARIHRDGMGHLGVFGDLLFGYSGRHDERHFEGFMVLIPTDERPPEQLPRPDDDIATPGELIVSVPGELFPYLYMRSAWPTVGADAMTRRFLTYPVPDPVPSESFYQALLTAHAESRTSMHNCALGFIEGTSFVAGPADLNDSTGRLAAIGPLTDAWLDTVTPSPQTLLTQLFAMFEVENEQALAAILASPGYQAGIERLWDSYLALIIIAEYEQQWLRCLIEMLVAAHFLDYLFAPATPVRQPTITLVQELMHASLILPAQLLPMPPASSPSVALAAPAPTPITAGPGWIAPYAIGELQMVRQRLLRYEPGEIAHIENVMRGEKREIGRRRMQRHTDSEHRETGSIETLENQSDDLRNSLYEETSSLAANKTVDNTYSDVTSYGPPTQGTLKGSWTENTAFGPKPAIDDMTRFARELLNRTVGRITRHVGQARSSSTLHETEERIDSIIDNTAGTAHLTAVYRWLNKVYEADVVNYGKRLMLEFMLPRPAAELLRARAADGGRFARPRPFTDWQVFSFRDIKDYNYAELAACYGVTELAPPPSTRYVSGVLRSGEEKQLPLPDGYQASGATVACLPGVAVAALPDVQVMVGTVLFDTVGTTAEAIDAPDRFGQDSCMPVSVSSYPEVAAAPPPYTPTAYALVNVCIACNPTEATMDRWRMDIYATLLRAYGQRMAEFDRLADDGRSPAGPVRSRRAERDIERRELKRGCLRLLTARLCALDGGGTLVSADAQPSVFEVNAPRYLQFFDELLEWDEMSYRWYGADGLPSQQGLGEDADAPFRVFLGAELARVMLPVAPTRTMALLYFLSSGMLWDGDDHHAPLTAADTLVVNDLKSAGLTLRRRCRRVGQPWEVVVPTSMQVLDDGGLCFPSSAKGYP